MPVSSSNIIHDTMFFLRDFLRTNITDPITRLTNEQFVMTSYPQLPTSYPLITIKDLNIISEPLGLQSEDQLITMTIEIRVWGRNVIERDRIAQEILNDLRLAQIGASGSQENNLFDFRLLSTVNVDEEKLKSKVMTIKYIFVAV